MKNFFKIILHTFLLIGGLSTLTLSAQTPRGLSSDDRIKTIIYQPDNVVNIFASQLITTQLILGVHETVTDIQCGDSAAWSIVVSQSSPNIINIKPVMPVSNTNLTVLTHNKSNRLRRYIFHLQTINSQQLTDATFSVRFINPPAISLPIRSQDINVSINPVNPEYHWDYRFHGCRSIVPQRVFDDGHFTYFQFKPGQVVPAFFMVKDAQGHEALINMRHEGQYWLALQLARQFTLRSSVQCVASIFNHQQIDHFPREHS